MKAILPLLLCCMFSFAVKAAVHVVDNNPNNTTAYSTIQDAVDAAADNDTIYIQPSSTLYDSPTLTKTLVIIGAGRHPNKQNHNTSRMVNLVFGLESSGSSILGLVITNIVSGEGAGIDNITITHCRIKMNLTIWGNNYYIANNVISQQFNTSIAAINVQNSGGSYSNIIIENNIIASWISSLEGSSNVLRNNLFLSNSSYSNVFSNGVNNISSNIIIENNIFYGSSPEYCSACTFNNNITFQTTQDILPYGSSTGVDNLVWFEIGFVNVPVPGLTVMNNLYTDRDFHLDTDAPGLTGGTDGNEIGLFGGSTLFSMDGEPPIPVVREFILENSSIPIDGVLQISVSSSAPQ